jgi:staphylococcal nuclease domain-containing protein 1
VIRHRNDEERSSVYPKLLELQEAAKAAKKGIFSGREAPPTRSNDISTPGNGIKAKAYLPSLQRSGKVTALVEYVLSGHRLKVGNVDQGTSQVLRLSTGFPYEVLFLSTHSSRCSSQALVGVEEVEDFRLGSLWANATNATLLLRLSTGFP